MDKWTKLYVGISMKDSDKFNNSGNEQYQERIYFFLLINGSSFIKK